MRAMLSFLGVLIVAAVATVIAWALALSPLATSVHIWFNWEVNFVLRLLFIVPLLAIQGWLGAMGFVLTALFWGEFVMHEAPWNRKAWSS